MKFHAWTEADDRALLAAIRECEPLFEHFKTQGSSYTKMDAWNAVAGRLLPGVCVTGAACKRRLEVIRKEQGEDGWEKTAKMVASYERDLAETTFDGVAELLGTMDAVLESISSLTKAVTAQTQAMRDLRKMWE